MFTQGEQEKNSWPSSKSHPGQNSFVNHPIGEGFHSELVTLYADGVLTRHSGWEYTAKPALAGFGPEKRWAGTDDCAEARLFGEI
jgi:hypothetical protein